MEKSEEPTGLLRSEVTILLPVRHEQHDHLPGTSKIAFQLFIVVVEGCPQRKDGRIG